jgi:hypothetical protein
MVVKEDAESESLVKVTLPDDIMVSCFRLGPPEAASLLRFRLGERARAGPR